MAHLTLADCTGNILPSFPTFCFIPPQYRDLQGTCCFAVARELSETPRLNVQDTYTRFGSIIVKPLDNFSAHCYDAYMQGYFGTYDLQNYKISTVQEFRNFIQTLDSMPQYNTSTILIESLELSFPKIDEDRDVFLYTQSKEWEGSLAKLSKLKSLKLKNTEFSDLSFLKHFPNLESLVITDNSNRLNIKAVSDCPSLKELRIQKIRHWKMDLTPIEGLKKLDTLEISYSINFQPSFAELAGLLRLII